MNLATIQALVANGESEILELKATTGQLREAIRTVSAMRNGSGGHVLFGVRDDGSIVGQMVTTHTIEQIAVELRKIEPPVDVHIEQVMLDSGRQVIVLSVPGGSGRGPYAYDGRCYSRIGPTTGLMSERQREQMTMERLHGIRRWENEAAPDWVSLSDLDEAEILRVDATAQQIGRIPARDGRSSEEILRGLGLIVEDRLLNAAVVLFGQSQRLLPYYPQLMVRLARFLGTTRLADFGDNRQYWGHIFEQLRRAEAFLLDHVPIASRVHSDRMVREDRPRYAPRATREALANAVCHRDYSNGGGAVTVAIYDDRLEIANPGSLHFGLTPEALMRPHESRPWNPIIANVCYLAGTIEKWGTGTLNIIEWSQEVGAVPPVWRDQGDAVVVTFLPAAVIESHDTDGPDDVLLAKRILMALVDGHLSRSELALTLGQSRRSGQFQDVIRDLLERELIAYTIPEKPTSPNQRYVLTDRGISAANS